jgi:acyl carrier protein
MSSESTIRAALRQWISSTSTKTTLESLDDDTPLFRNGILKSVQVSDLILYIEELAERAVDVEQIKPGVFRDIDSIYRNFFTNDHA